LSEQFKNASGLEFIEINDDFVVYGDDKIKIGCIPVVDDFNNPQLHNPFEECFIRNVYEFKSKSFDVSKKYIVLDIGGYIGDSAIYFSQFDWCKKVYSFEIIPTLFNYSKKIIELNSSAIREKIEMFNFGLGSEDTKFIMDTYDKYICSEKKSEVTVKQASKILKEIIKKENICDIIFKIDVEGAEYEIIKDLKDNYPEIFTRISILCGETHSGFKKFFDFLPKEMFCPIYIRKNSYDKIDGLVKEFEIANTKNMSFNDIVEGQIYSMRANLDIGYKYGRISGLPPTNSFTSQIFYDIGDGFKNEQFIMCSDCFFEDKVHNVRFNLEKIKDIKALRFDPLEGLFCKTKILSVKSDNDNFRLNSVCCQNNTDGFDLFYTTDPQYYGAVEGNITFVDIEFELEIVNEFEVQCAVYGLNDNKNELVKLSQKLNRDIDDLSSKCDWYANTLKEKDSAIGDLNGKCDWYANTLKEKDSTIDNMNKELYSVYNSRSWKLTKPFRKLMKLLRKSK
jgi:FkbM family methyltransferase